MKKQIIFCLYLKSVRYAFAGAFQIQHKKVGLIFMKKTTNRTKRMMVAILAAAVIAAAPAANIVPVLLTASAADVKLENELNPVETKGELIVEIPDGVSDSYKVEAYEMLQLMIAKGSRIAEDSSLPNPMTNNDNNIYVVTDKFAYFFSKAKEQYNDTTDKLYDEDTLYLSYDAENSYLKITKDKPSGDYITIDNTAYSDGHKGKLDKTYFEADIVSRITSNISDETETEARAASDARLLSDWASRYVKAKSLKADATSTKSDKKFEFKDSSALVYGYYVIVTSDDTTDNDKSVINQSILNVPWTNTVTLKATPITVDKSVDNLIDANKKNNGEATLKKYDSTKLDVDTVGGEKYDKITANIGDILQYKVESHIPALTSYVLNDGELLALSVQLTEDNFANQIKDKFVYTFRDTMINQDFIPAKVTDTNKYGAVVEGLIMQILNADKTVKATYYVKEADGKYYLVTDEDDAIESNAIGRLWETDYNATNKKNFFAINFDLGKLKSLGLDGKDVVFTYNAELKGEAGNDDATNTAKFTYSNDPYDSKSTDTIEHENKVYTYDLKVDKIFSDGATNLYGEVKFKLYSDSEMTNVIKFVKKSDGSYVRVDSDDTDKEESPIDGDGIIAVNTTDGTLRLHGLGEGTYYLEEQTNDDLSGAGYNKVNPIEIIISAKDAGDNITDSATFDLFNGNSTAVTAKLDEVPFTPGKIGGTDEYGIEFNVVNQKGFKLPFTGEFGNWALAISGILLVAVGGTVIVLVNRKKKDSPTDNEK